MRRKIVTFLFLGIIVGCSIIVENRHYKIKTEDGVIFGTLHHKEYEKLVIFKNCEVMWFIPLRSTGIQCMVKKILQLKRLSL
jgi:hypothetical protein